MDGWDDAACPRLITRGNLDGIACAAVFLERYPGGSVEFVTSPPKAVTAASASQVPTMIADLPLTAEMAELLSAANGRVRLVDHHPTPLRSRHASIDLTRSAAGALHAYLGGRERPALAAALADQHESTCAPHDDDLREEASLLDLAWRHNVEDDAFRLAAARALSEGRRPSDIPLIAERGRMVRQGPRWMKAVEAVGTALQVKGKIGVMDLRGRRLSLHGFGSVALVEVAKARGCDYTLLLHDSRGDVTASLRSTGQGHVDLGSFAERFTLAHGREGGGHPRSAGARVPMAKADLLVDHLVAVSV